MIAMLLALAPFIPAMLSVAAFFIKMFGASKADLEAYLAMVQKNKDAGLITVETYTKLNDFHAAMLQELEAKQKPKEEKKPDA